MPIKTKRGLTLSIEQAEILCSLKFHNDTDQSVIQDAAASLSSYFLSLKNRKKTLRYAMIATGGKLPDDFEFKFSDPFNWYNVFRVFIISINRFVGVIARPFLPVWYALFGLFYLLQGVVAHVKKDHVNRNYWTVWFFINAFACLLALGAAIGLGALLVSGGIPLVTAGTAVWLSSLLFDVGFDVFKYKTERQKHEDLYNQLKETGCDDLADQVLTKIKAMKQSRKASFIASNVIFIGGIIFGISTFFPPLFFALSITGASLILAAYTYLAFKKIKNSWTSDTGLLNHYVRKPCAKFIKEKLFKTKNHGLTIEIPRDPTQEFIAPETISIHSPTLTTAKTPKKISAPVSAIDPLESTTIIETKLSEKLKESTNLIEDVSALGRHAKNGAPTILKTKTDQAWNDLLATLVIKYQGETSGGLYNCNLKQTIQICRNNLKSILKSHQKALENNTPEDIEHTLILNVIRRIEKRLRFLNKMEKNFNGDPKEDLLKVKIGTAELNQLFSRDQFVDSRLKNIKNLLILMGIKDIAGYKKQYKRWKDYYAKNSGKNLSPFFDRSIDLLKDTCNFDPLNQEQMTRRPLKVSI